MVCTLMSMCNFLKESLEENENAAFRENVFNPLSSISSEFENLKQCIEECIDIQKASQNDYMINPNFKDSLG